MNLSDYGLSLDGLIKSGTDAYNSTVAKDAAKAQAQAATAQANSAATQSNNLIRFGLIGGGVLLAIVALVMVFKRK